MVQWYGQLLVRVKERVASAVITHYPRLMADEMPYDSRGVWETRELYRRYVEDTIELKRVISDLQAELRRVTLVTTALGLGHSIYNNRISALEETVNKLLPKD